MLPLANSFFQDANLIEAMLWFAIAGVFAISLLLPRRPARVDRAIAALAFALFGVSDLIERHTGAWWRPWWLLAIKAACVATFLVLLIRHYRRREMHRRNGLSPVDSQHDTGGVASVHQRLRPVDRRWPFWAYLVAVLIVPFLFILLAWLYTRSMRDF